MNENVNPETESDEDAPDSALQKRTEVLSVKTSVPEKDMILRAAKIYKMPYSEFIRMVSLTVCRNMGLQEVSGLTTEDVRRPRPRTKTRRAPDADPVADASGALPVAV